MRADKGLTRLQIIRQATAKQILKFVDYYLKGNKDNLELQLLRATIIDTYIYNTELKKELRAKDKKDEN